METAEYAVMHAAEDHHWWYVGLHDLVVRLVRAERERVRRPLRILDAGCGTGRLCQLMQPFGDVAGCDIHPLALEATAKRGINTVLQRDLVTDELGFERFDVITCMDVLVHRKITDEVMAVHNLYRALRKGGLLLLQVAAFELLRGTHDAAVHSTRRYRWSGVVRLLESAGFTTQFASHRLCLPFLPAILWRSFSRRFPNYLNRDGIASDTSQPCPPLLNRMLTCYVKAENALLASGVYSPMGMSIFAAARK
jgi:SAM-dependent methyltransferase